MVDLLKIATDPEQYDLPEVGWQDGGAKGLEEPHRRHFLQYVETVIPNWYGRKVLDIGAGSGWLMKYALDSGAEVAKGFDPSSNNIKFAQDLFGLEVSQASIETYSPGEQKFDLAIAIYVLTHVQDLEAAFANISDWLEPNGDFVAIVPDLEYAKRPRADFEIEVEPLPGEAYEAYVIRVKRDHGAIADIVRDVRIYEEVAAKYGLELVKHIEMKPTDILLKEFPRYREYPDTTLTHLLHFRKISH